VGGRKRRHEKWDHGGFMAAVRALAYGYAPIPNTDDNSEERVPGVRQETVFDGNRRVRSGGARFKFPIPREP
jgi:hypothetical protein